MEEAVLDTLTNRLVRRRSLHIWFEIGLAWLVPTSYTIKRRFFSVGVYSSDTNGRTKIILDMIDHHSGECHKRGWSRRDDVKSIP